MNDEYLKELVEEMQEFLHKGNKLVNKAKKQLEMPMGGMMGQRNFPHDLPPAFPQYPGEYGTWMNRMQGFGERGGNSGNNSGGNSGMNSGGMGERGGYNNREGGGYDPRYM